jgi:hypothetical protein
MPAVRSTTLASWVVAAMRQGRAIAHAMAFAELIYNYERRDAHNPAIDAVCGTPQLDARQYTFAPQGRQTCALRKPMSTSVADAER